MVNPVLSPHFSSRKFSRFIFSPLFAHHQNTINLFWDDSKLTTYIDKCLQPLVDGLKDHPALGAWEVYGDVFFVDLI
jgi:hypothetical protein